MTRKIGATMSVSALARSTSAGDAQYSEAQECGARRGAALLRQWRIPERCAAVIPDEKAVVPVPIGEKSVLIGVS
jgi:hypothetical protein